MSQLKQVNILGGGYHSGLDISTGANDPLYSIVDGRVIYTGWQENGYGNYIIIKDDNSDYAFLYGHMRDPAMVNIGDHVQIGQQVGIERNIRKFNRNTYTYRDGKLCCKWKSMDI